jgi:Fe-S cluster biosynthesis and repair protein YggX
MAHMVFCVRNKKEMEGLDEPPFDSEFGQKIYKNVSKAAWAEWAERQKMLLNGVGTWLSLVEHSLGVRGVGSSNLPVPTICRKNVPAMS